MIKNLIAKLNRDRILKVFDISKLLFLDCKRNKCYTIYTFVVFIIKFRRSFS